MVDWLRKEHVYCERCEQNPHIRDCLGCGEPPTRDDDPLQALWDWDKTGTRQVSPLQAVREGKAPFRGIGHKGVVTDWPWCPLWFHSRLLGKPWGSDATVEDVPTDVYLRKAYKFWKLGMLPDLVPPPWTVGFVELLLLFDVLEQVEQQDREAKEAENFSKRLQSMLAGGKVR